MKKTDLAKLVNEIIQKIEECKSSNHYILQVHVPSEYHNEIHNRLKHLGIISHYAGEKFGQTRIEFMLKEFTVKKRFTSFSQ